MKREHFITATEFCSGHDIEMTFLYNLDENGLIRLERSEDTVFIEEEQLSNLERIVRLYFDLGINFEGIETIINLLERTEDLQEQINTLKNRLRLYEDL
ncbi:MAG: chaperone modulator CbpM [Chloroflexota bacterium]